LEFLIHAGKNKAVKHPPKIYPDVTDILGLKQEGRREISRRSLGAKIAMVEVLRERLKPLKRIRELRRAETALKKDSC
jgi:hypothetical protein